MSDIDWQSENLHTVTQSDILLFSSLYTLLLCIFSMHDHSSLSFTLSLCIIYYLGLDYSVATGLTASEVAMFTASDNYSASVSVDSSTSDLYVN